MNQRNAVGRSLRFDCPPFNADQWVQELIGFVPVGAVEFRSNSPFIWVNGASTFPEGHQGIITHIRVTMVDTLHQTDAHDHTWTLLRNGSPVPGFKERALEADLNHVPPQNAQVDLTAALTLTAALVTNGTINGLLQGFPSAVCPAGCDYLLANLVGGLGWVEAGTITGTAGIDGTLSGLAVTDRHVEQRQKSGLPGVLVPVWMNPGDQFSLVVSPGNLGVSVCASVGGAIWPVPSDAAAGAE